MWFSIHDQLVRFAIEFCLISGLRCSRNGDSFTRYEIKKSRLKEHYFKKYFSTKVIQKMFLNLLVNTVEKDVDIGLFYFITFFLVGTSYHKGVDDSLSCHVESEEMNFFPLGKEFLVRLYHH